MGMPRCLLLVESVHHGNTATVARAIADELGADVAVPEAVPYTSLAGYSLIGFGSGVYYGQVHPALLDWVRGLPDTPVKNNPAFIFSTSGSRAGYTKTIPMSATSSMRANLPLGSLGMSSLARPWRGARDAQADDGSVRSAQPPMQGKRRAGRTVHC